MMSVLFAANSALQGLKLDEAKHDLIHSGWGGGCCIVNDCVKSILKRIFQRIYFQPVNDELQIRYSAFTWRPWRQPERNRKTNIGAGVTAASDAACEM
jgi:hypothetical protein